MHRHSYRITERRVVFTPNDFIEYFDEGAGTNRIAKIEGIFVHELLRVCRAFLRIRHVAISADQDIILDLPKLELAESWELIGLPRIQARNMYVVAVHKSLIWVEWTTVVFL